MQQQFAAIATRVDQMQAQLNATAAEHQQLHPIVTSHEQGLGELRAVLVDVQRFVHSSGGVVATEVRKGLGRGLMISMTMWPGSTSGSRQPPPTTFPRPTLTIGVWSQRRSTPSTASSRCRPRTLQQGSAAPGLGSVCCNCGGSCPATLCP